MATIASLNVVLGMDTASFAGGTGRARQQLTDLERVAESVWDSTRTPMERYQARLSQLNGLLARGQLDQETYARATAAAAEQLDRASRAAERAAGPMTDLAATARRVWEQTRTPMERYQAELSQLNGLVRRGNIDQQTYVRALARAREELNRTAQGAHRLADANRRTANVTDVLSRALRRATGLAASYLSVTALFHAAKHSVDLAADFEKTSVAMEVLVRDAGLANRMLAELYDYAAKTPFEFPDVARAGKLLLGFGVEAEKIGPTIEMLGNLSSGLEIPLTELAEIFGRNRSQAHLFARDIQEFAGRGIPILKGLAKEFGVSEGAVMGLVEQGKVGFADLERTLAAMTAEGGQFAGLTDRLSQTMAGKLSTAIDDFNAALRETGKTIGEAVVPQLSQAASLAAELAKMGTGAQNMPAAQLEARISRGSFASEGDTLPEIEQQIEKWQALVAQVEAKRREIEDRFHSRSKFSPAKILIDRPEMESVNRAAELAAAKMEVLLRLQKEFASRPRVSANKLLGGSPQDLIGQAIDGLTAVADRATNAAGALDSYARQWAAAAKAAAKVAQDTNRLTDSLKDQVATFGMSSRQAQIFMLAQQGASDAQLAEARALDAQLTKLEQMREAEQRWASEHEEILASLETDADRLYKELKKIQFQFDIGNLTKAQKNAAMALANEKFGGLDERAAHADTHNAALEYGTAEAFHASFGGKSDSRTFLQMLKALMKSQRDTERIRLLQEKNNVKPADF